MKLTFVAGVLPLALLLAGSEASAQNVLKYVNPNIGTAHSRWFFYTPAAVPYGMAKLAPSTNGHYGNPSGWEAVGYDARQNSIEGFVHFHEWQVGGGRLANQIGKPLLSGAAGLRHALAGKQSLEQTPVALVP